MPERRSLRTLLTSARVSLGCAAGIAVVGAVLVAVPAPLPTLERTPVSLVETPTASETVAVCAGPLLASGRVAGSAGDVALASPSAVISVAESSTAPLATERLRPVTAPDSTGAPVLRLPPTGREPSALAAAQSASVADEDLVGFDASSCDAPQFDSWLAGGASSTGASDLVILANPGDVAATVQITAYAQSGLSSPPGGEDVVVPARAQIVIPLAGLVLGEFTPVLRVQATGAPVAAHLQSSRTVTLEPVGVDLTGATGAPALEQVIPGIVTQVSADPDVAESSTARVRVLAPSAATTATITIHAVGQSAPATTPAPVQLEAGVPLDIDLPGLSAGSYVARLSAGVPIVAAAWATSALTGPRDFAWLPSAARLDAPTLLAVAAAPAGTATALHAAAGEDPVDVTLTPQDGGAPVVLSIGASESGSIVLPSGSTWRAEASAPFFAAIAYSSATTLAGYPVQPGPGATTAIRVLP